jgi:hypothetical protein
MLFQMIRHSLTEAISKVHHSEKLDSTLHFDVFINIKNLYSLPLVQEVLAQLI